MQLSNDRGQSVLSFQKSGEINVISKNIGMISAFFPNPALLCGIYLLFYFLDAILSGEREGIVMWKVFLLYAVNRFKRGSHSLFIMIRKPLWDWETVWRLKATQESAVWNREKTTLELSLNTHSSRSLKVLRFCLLPMQIVAHYLATMKSSFEIFHTTCQHCKLIT